MFVTESHVYKPCIDVTMSEITPANKWLPKQVSKKYCHGNIYVSLAGKTSAVLDIENIKISGQQERWDWIWKGALFETQQIWTSNFPR